MTTMRVVGECFFWYRLTRVFPDKFHRAVKRLCVCVSSLVSNTCTRINISRTTTLEFQDFSRVFQDLCLFPGLSRVCTNPVWCNLCSYLSNFEHVLRTKHTALRTTAVAFSFYSCIKDVYTRCGHARPWALLKWLNRLRCRLGCKLAGRAKRQGCTGVPPGKYDWTIQKDKPVGELVCALLLSNFRVLPFRNKGLKSKFFGDRIRRQPRTPLDDFTFWFSGLLSLSIS